MSESGTLLSTHGMVDHSEFYNEDGLSGWWGGSTSIRRSIFMGDYVYAFSAAGALGPQVPMTSTSNGRDRDSRVRRARGLLLRR